MAVKFRAQKGTPLTYSELDNNFGSYFYSASVSNTSVTLHYPASLEVPVNSGSVSFSLVKGLEQTGADRRIPFYSGSSELSSDPNLGVDVSGSVGIGVDFTNDFPLDYKLTVSGSIKATGTVFQGSDERLKKDIYPIDNALSKIDSIDGVNFTYKDTDEKSIGVIAQQIQKILPEVVSEQNNGYLNVNYSGIVPVLIEAVREQKSIIDNLVKRIETLENK